MNENVSTVTNLVRDKVAELNKVRQDAIVVIRENFKDLFMEFFEKHPAVECVSWTQYTPYYMDGEPCVFSVNDFGYKTFADTSEDYIYGESVNGWRWDAETKTRVKRLTDEEIALGYTLEMCDDWSNLQDDLRKIPDDIYQELFGDGSQITVNRDGVTVVDYDHD